MVQARKSFVVAAAPRVGSGLLCYGLSDTRIAGNPTELFAPHLRDEWCRLWTLDAGIGFDAFFAAGRRYGTSTNGIFGFKIHWMHLAGLAANARSAPLQVLGYLVPHASFIHVVRRDLRAQALSYYRALATDEWERHRGDAPLASVVSAADADVIHALEVELTGQRESWNSYFEANAIWPLTVEYEALIADYRGEIARSLTFLGLDPSVAASLPSPRIVQQRDRTASTWSNAVTSPSGP